MALFKREPEPKLPPPPAEPLINTVYRLLDQIGTFRLKVRDPRVKVYLTQIAQTGERSLTGGSSEPPSDMAIIEFRGHLESVVRVLEQYVEFQDHPDQYPSADDGLSEGRKALAGFTSFVTRTSTPGGTREMTNFKVDTKILSAQQHR